MVSLIYFSLLACTIVIMGGIILLKFKNVKKTDDTLAVLQEASFTALLGIFSMALAYCLLIMKIIDPSMAGNDGMSYLFIALFAFICALSGTFVILWTFLKNAIAYKDKLLLVSFLGTQREMRWCDVNQIKVPMLSKKITFVTSDASYSVFGAPKQYKKFIEVVHSNTGHAVGSDALENFLKRLCGN